MSETIAKDQPLLCNPDVVLREEDEDGGLLFNPDNNAVKIVNSTGLFIWKQFQSINTPESAAVEVLKNFEDATQEVIQTDLEEFLQDMLLTGFIGKVINE
jgi:ubiquinone biosynthesis protein Coq4